MFDNFYVNLRKNERFLTYIPFILIPEYGQSNAPLVFPFSNYLTSWYIVLNSFSALLFAILSFICLVSIVVTLNVLKLCVKKIHFASYSSK